MKTKVEFIKEIMDRIGEDFVTTKRVDEIYGEQAINIKIGRRDVTVTNTEITGSGFFVIDIGLNAEDILKSISSKLHDLNMGKGGIELENGLDELEELLKPYRVEDDS